MRLLDLDPSFLVIEDPRRYRMTRVMADADGVEFLCPKCFQTNNGPVGTHRVICWRPHVPQDVHPVPGRWEWQGIGLGDLTLVAGSSSVHIDPEGKGSCHAHFFVRNGEIVFA